MRRIRGLVGWLGLGGLETCWEAMVGAVSERRMNEIRRFVGRVWGCGGNASLSMGVDWRLSVLPKRLKSLPGGVKDSVGEVVWRLFPFPTQRAWGSQDCFL